jgi:hypothetical protein
LTDIGKLEPLLTLTEKHINSALVFGVGAKSQDFVFSLSLFFSQRFVVNISHFRLNPFYIDFTPHFAPARPIYQAERFRAITALFCH